MDQEIVKKLISMIMQSSIVRHFLYEYLDDKNLLNDLKSIVIEQQCENEYVYEDELEIELNTNNQYISVIGYGYRGPSIYAIVRCIDECSETGQLIEEFNIKPEELRKWLIEKKTGFE